MKPLTVEWIFKADEDLRIARAMLDLDSPSYDGAAFHAQQGAEKYLTAALQERGVPTPRTHDLPLLLSLWPDAPGASTR